MTLSPHNQPQNNGVEKAKKKTSLYFYAVCAYLIMDIGRIPELFPFLQIIQPLKIVGGLAIISVLLNKNGIYNIRTKIKLPQVKCILGILILGIVTIPFGVWRGNSFSFVINHYWKLIVTFILVIGSISSMEDFRKIIWSLFIAVGFLTLFAVRSEAMGRISVSTYYDPNDLSMVVILALPFAVFVFLREKGVKQILLGVLILFILRTLILTVSRGGFIGFAAVTAFILFRVRKIGKKVIIPFMLIIAVGAGTFFFYAKSDYWERIRSIAHYEEDYNVTDAYGRVEVWKRGLKIMKEHFVLGVGINNFPIAEGLSHQDIKGKWSTAHNAFIQIGAELGIIGLILFCYIIYSTFRKINEIISEAKDKTKYLNIMPVLIGLQCAWLGYIFVSFFLSTGYSSLFYLLAGLSTSAYYFIVKMEEEHGHSPIKK